MICKIEKLLVVKIFCLFAFIFFNTNVLSQRAELRKVLFEEVGKKLDILKANNAELLSPTNYNRAFEKYTKAVEEFEKGKDASDIRKRVNQIEEDLQKAETALELSKTIVIDALKARDDALSARASEFALDAFEKAERIFKEAGMALEKGNASKARKKSAEAEAAYRNSELIAIKISVMAPAKDAIDAADRMDCAKYSAKTFKKAQTLLTLAEEILNSDRYAVSDATKKAEEASYEARHAMQLSKETLLLKEKKRTFEEEIIYYEEHLNLISKALGFDSQFDSELQKPIKAIIDAINSLKEEKAALVQDLQERDNEITSLRESIKKVQDELVSFQEKEAGLQSELAKQKRELEEKKRKEAKIKKVRNIFTPAEAAVVLEGNRLVIRLFGLSFPVGKAVIEPAYFNLLAKVQRAIREYPNAKITIEGHTDSVGDERYNLRLSTQRAQSVRSYLIANMGIMGNRLDAIGYGESRPIASNETAPGRAKNRRTDIVLFVE